MITRVIIIHFLSYANTSAPSCSNVCMRVHGVPWRKFNFKMPGKEEEKKSMNTRKGKRRKRSRKRGKGGEGMVI